MATLMLATRDRILHKISVYAGTIPESEENRSSQKTPEDFHSSSLRDLQGRTVDSLTTPPCRLGESQERSISSRIKGLSKTQRWIYHLQSIWLFTFSDIKTIIGPKTAFGILNASCAPVFGISSTLPALWILPKILITSFWIWINLLPFAIDNQRQPAAIMEDSLNKPWRPMPSKRLTPRQAKRMIFILYPTACLVSGYIGGLRQCIALIFLGYWYNDCGGADVSCITRNLINACGFICYSSGAMEVALGSPLPLNPRLIQWFLIIGGVVFSTVQTQDLCDQAGDNSRGRRTIPLVLGDGRCRWITTFTIALWSFVCPWYWVSRHGLYAVYMALGSVIIFRMLTKRSVEDDKKTFRLWNIWIVFMYSLPLMKHISNA